VLLASAAAVMVLAGTVAAKSPSTKKQEPLPPRSGMPLALQHEEAVLKAQAGGMNIEVTSTAFSNNAAIPSKYSAYDNDTSLPMAWSRGAEGTKSYVLIMEDPDSKKPPVPVVHWIAWNIPPSRTSLPEGLPKRARLEDPEGLRQGLTTAGSGGYHGPRPSQGDPPHHYHVQLFALDADLDILAGSTRDELLKAMQGHVLAKGELVGTFARP